MFYCKSCGKSTEHKPSNRRSFCNNDCFKKWAKETHVNRNRDKRLCKNCKLEFECIPSSDMRFCNHSCAATFNNKHRKIDSECYKKVSEANKKAYKDGKMIGLQKGWVKNSKIKKICPICEKSFTVNKKSLKKYCSKSCAHKRTGQGGYRPGSVRNFKSGWYISPIAGKVWMDSSYEFIMAEYLDSKLYKWIKNHKGFPYIKTNGKEANYIPDFYIEDLDLWVETKGYETEDDKMKIKYFPHKIILIGKKTIHNKETWGF